MQFLQTDSGRGIASRAMSPNQQKARKGKVMNKEKLKSRMKKSVLGRVFCRLVGEDRGAVMMEYVIVAVLIAAAVAAAVAYFGQDIAEMFGVAGKAATGDINSSANKRTQVSNNVDTRAENALKTNQTFHDAGDGAGGGEGGNK